MLHLIKGKLYAKINVQTQELRLTNRLTDDGGVPFPKKGGRQLTSMFWILKRVYTGMGNFIDKSTDLFFGQCFLF